MAVVRHVEFLKVGNFNCWYGSENQCAPPAKFLADRSRRCQDMAVFDFPVGLLKVRKFNGPTLRMTNVRHRAKFHADRSSRCGDMAAFDFFKMAAVCHLGFLKVGIFNCPYPLEGQYASSCQISCGSVKTLRRYGRFSIFRDGGRPSSWRASAILDLLYACLDHPRKSIWWSLSLCKI